MPTTAQILANRNNSQKSTGPQTDEGKAVVSQNAVKHGLFAAEAVITGENPADYELYHDQFLAELAPVGMLESLLAERIISLGWRLQRAERMQNQAIEDMIECEVTNPRARDRRKSHCNNERIRPDDPRYDPDHLALGRVAAGDWSYFRVLDRMLLYERRIENSLNKTINKLKTQQMIRVIQQAEARKQETAQASPEPVEGTGPKACGFEAATQSNSPSQSETATRPAEKECDLKKQSQFPPALMGATSYEKGGYDNMPACGIEENKANSSLS
ncbi:MAG: hypothetical protein WBC05_17065 [Sedimentisphaerales bacterium]